jgi:DNA-directed RNA polymerase subunit RPC12/RpoP
MRYLPLALTRGPLLAQVIRESYRDPRRHSLCACCGSRMLIQPERIEQTVRCPACARWQRVIMREEVPWRLSAASAEALRRTRSWVRRL